MPSKNYGWVRYGESVSGRPPAAESVLTVVVTANFGGDGFYWSINPGVEVIHSMTSAGRDMVLTFLLESAGGGGGRVRWLPSSQAFLTFQDETISEDLYELGARGGQRTLTLKRGFPSGEHGQHFFTLHLEYNPPGQQSWTDVSLDPELDVGMEGVG